ncbi:hypothetical protein [Pseudomonas sp.]|uniref:hypothetical protein n=1 Tax=Pseudomonas sp. TaxID=306 RepID=UPI002D7F9DA2|nr:hypothetical protein [Pseudomonas sp.]
MHRSKAVMLGLMVLSSATMTEAQEPSESSFALGLSSYATVFSVDTYKGSDEFRFGGAAINATLSLNNNLALRGHLYSQEWEDASSTELSGFDLQLLLGSNLAREGFKYYLSLGLFSEELEEPGYSRSLSGTMIGFGLGYNWERVALDFSLHARQAQPYADMLEELGYPYSGTVSAGSGALSLAYRF